MIELRPYQQKAIIDIREKYRLGYRAPLLVSPTGSGKTRIFSFICKTMEQANKRVLILAHRQELLEQISAALVDLNVSHGMISPDYREELHKPVQVASVLSLVRRRNWPVANLVIADECHHSTAGSWRAILDKYSNSHLLGVTATPVRLSGEGLGEVFDCMVSGPTVKELVALGFLTPLTVFAHSNINTEDIGTRMGEFIRNDLNAACDNPVVTGDALSHYQRIAAGKQAIVFCVSVEHAKHVANQFASVGIKALPIDGSLSKQIRSTIVRDYCDAKIQVLTSCDLVSEGFDVPRIEVGISLRPTQSTGLWLQQVGRILRPFPGKTRAILLDHAGNSMRHGLPNEDREWSLEGREHRTRGEVAPGVRVCEKCFAASNAGAAICGNCAEPFTVKPREFETQEGELKEIDAELLAKARRQEQGQAGTLEQLRAIGRATGRHHRWAEYVWAARKRKAGVA